MFTRTRERNGVIKVKHFLSACVLVAAWSAAPARGDIAATIEGCNGCHGENGVSQWTDMPTIAGIDAFVHSEALFVFRDRARPCAVSDYRSGDTSRDATTMCDIVQDMSDEDIEAIAEHYAALPFVPAEQPFDATLAAAGEARHERDCARCHTDGGSNPADEAGILAGQWMGYLETTFAQYASGEREQPRRMKEKMDELTPDDVEALIHYYASQQ